MTQETKPLEYCLALEYSFNAIADPDGGYVVVFPDLPGCMTQVESLDEIPYMVEDVRVGWLETVYDANPNCIPLPSYPDDCGGDAAHCRRESRAAPESLSNQPQAAGAV